MPKKKQPYVLFCQERQQTDPSLRSKSLVELVDLCSGTWRELAPGEKQKYIRMAKIYSDKRYLAGGGGGDFTSRDIDLAGKFDSSGQSLLAKQRKRVRAETYDRLMRDDITARVLKHDKTSSVPMMRVHILSVSNWIEGHGDDKIFPAEIGLVTVSVRDGVISRLNQMIDPGELPLGFRAEAKNHSDKHHQVWLDNPELSGNYYRIVDRIRAAVTARPDDDESFAGADINLRSRLEVANVEVTKHVTAAEENNLLPIYVMPTERRETIKSMRRLCERAEVDYEFTLYELPFLFWEMMAHAHLKLPETMTLNIVEDALKTDVFLYVKDVSCKYHESIASCCCAGGKSSRLAFILCDYGCQMFGIVPVEGLHVPNGINVDEIQDAMTSLSLSSSDLVLEVAPNAAVARESFSTDHILSGMLTRESDGRYTMKSVDEIVGEPVEIPPHIQRLLGVPLEDTMYFSIDENTTTVINPDDCQRLYPKGEDGSTTFQTIAE